MDVLRTPDSRFENLEGYPFVANYLDVAASDTEPLRMHFLDEGPADGPPIVLLRRHFRRSIRRHWSPLPATHRSPIRSRW